MGALPPGGTRVIRGAPYPGRRRYLADGELTRREALKRLGLLGLSATATGAIPAAFANDNREATAPARRH